MSGDAPPAPPDPATPAEARASRRPLVLAGLPIGVGMGGFVDGILFHQILQLHNMLSAIRPPDTLVNVEINMGPTGLKQSMGSSTPGPGASPRRGSSCSSGPARTRGPRGPAARSRARRWRASGSST